MKNFKKVLEQEMKQYVPSLVAMIKPLKRVGILISGYGTNLQCLIDCTRDPTQHIGADIALVISNKLNVEGLKRAERAGIKTAVIHIDISISSHCICVSDKPVNTLQVTLLARFVGDQS